MKNAIKYICDANPCYIYFKKHFCPMCNKRLELNHISKIVNSNSPDSQKYDFSVGDTFLSGDVEFRIKCFYCKDCNKNFSFQEIKKLEKKK